MEEIKSDMKSLEELFLNNEIEYIIPDFQRDFVWTKNEIIDLFDDFEEDTNGFEMDVSKLQGYLLGNIVLISENNSRYMVVDGQQRLTSISLIFKALYDAIIEKTDQSDGNERDKWVKRLSNLHNGFQISDDEDEFLSLKITHDVGLGFGSYYKGIIMNDEQRNADTDSDNNIEEVFQEINDRITTIKENDDLFKNFIKYLKKKVKIIETISPSESKAFQLFEVLNDRGRSLEPMDLIKNSLLKKLAQDKLDNHKNTFNDNWRVFIENLSYKRNNRAQKIQSSTFLKHFIVAIYGVIKIKDELFLYVKNDLDLSGEEVIEFSQKLKKYSRIYSSIESDWKNNDFLSNDNNMFILFKLMNNKQFHPLLMAFYDADTETKKKLVDCCVRYSATLLYSLRQTNKVEALVPDIINDIAKLNNYTDKIDFVVNRLNNDILQLNDNLKNVIETYNFVSANGKPLGKSLDVLKFIELYFNFNQSIIYPQPTKKISLEHILATKTYINDYLDYGFNDKDEMTKYLNRLGNLTILYGDENASVGNKIFKDKKAVYSETEFIITNRIVEKCTTSIKNGEKTRVCESQNEYMPPFKNETIWSKDEIEKRGENLSRLLIDIVNGKFL